MRLKLPDARLEQAFKAVKSHLHVFDDGDHFSPGTFLYHNHWFRDAAFIAMAFDHLGWRDRVSDKVPNMLKRQDKKGFFRSQNGEWDSNGQAIWTLVQHVRRGGDPILLQQSFNAVWAGARWIIRMRDAQKGSPSPHYGLLPAGFSAEHFGPNDHYWWDNLWSLAGLEAGLWAARFLNKSEAITWFEDHLEEYRADCISAMQLSLARMGGKVLPCSPYRTMDSAAIGNLVGISPLGVIGADAPWLRGTVDWLLQHNLRNGMFFQKIVHTGLNPYLTVQLARVLIALRDSRGFDLLQSILDLATDTFTWPEALHPRTFGGCMGDGDHGWSAAEFLNLVRALLIEDHTHELVLLAGAPTAWFQPGMHLQCFSAPTVYGTVDLRVIIGLEGLTIEWEISRASHQDSAGVTIMLPRQLFSHEAFLANPYEIKGAQIALKLSEMKGRLVLPLPQLRMNEIYERKIHV